MNEKIFLSINSLAGHWSWLDSLMVFSAEYLIYLMVLGVLVYVIWDYKRYRDMAIVAIGSAIMARFIVASSIRYFYYHARPYFVIAETNLLLAFKTESSFPSGHTIFVFALTTGVYQYNKKMGWWFYAGAALVGFSRIFTGVHWPYDIISGAVLGVLVGMVGGWGYRNYFKKYIENRT